ncbi:MAG: pectinesterase family protein [Bacteroidia bacterium]
MKKMLRFVCYGVVVMLFPLLSKAQVTLPWSEGFENIGSTTTFTSSTSSISGLSNVEFSTSSSGSVTGRLRFKAGSGFYKTGSAAATMDVNPSGAYLQNDLIITVDLRNYTSSDMELSFSWMEHGDEVHSGDRVWIRGSSSSTWVQVYDWSTVSPGNGKYTTVTGIDIDAALAANSQTVSSTFQIKFGQYDNFPATSTTASDGLTIDDISIIEIVPNNGTIAAVSPFCSGNADVKVVLENPGANAITSGQISWSVDGKTQTPKHFTTNIASKGSEEITLGTYNFSGSSSFDIIAQIDSINGVLDSARFNDTITIKASPSLAGTYTVGGSSANFSTIASAISAMESNGLCGPTTLRLAAQTFNERVVIPEIPGSSANNTLRIVGAGADKTTIANSASSTATWATIMLNGADYVTIDSVRVEANGSSYGVCYWLTNSADYNTISNSEMHANLTSTSSNHRVYVISSSSTSISSGAGGEYNLIDNCLLRGGYYGYYAYGSSSALANGNSINNSQFYQQYYYPIYNYYGRDKYIVNNNIDSVRNTSGYGMMIPYGANDSIAGNRVNATGYYNLYFYYQNVYGNSTDTTFFINNQVTGGSTYGLYASVSYRVKYYNNSFYTNNSYTVYHSTSTDCEWKNNSFQNDNSYCFYLTSTSGIATGAIDYNNYYAPNATNMAYYAGARSDLAAWQLSYPAINTSSISTDPQYNSSTNLSTLSPNLNNQGVNLIRVPVDFDGDSRPTSPDTKYDIGSDDYYLPPYDLDIMEVTPSVMAKGNNTIAITVRNTGLNDITSDTAYVSYARGNETPTIDSILISNLLKGQETTFYFNTKLAVSADTSFTLCASIDSGIVGDPDLVDQECITPCVGSSGTYSIDATGNGDFKTFEDAIASLNGCGVAGHITFEVEPGTYTEQLELTEINGAGADATISFVNAGNGQVLISNTGNSTTNWITVLFDGADYIIFDGIDIEAKGASYGAALFFTNESDHNTIKNCNLSATQNTSYYSETLVFSASKTSYSSYGNNGNYNLFENNVFNGGGYYGARINGGGSSSQIIGNQFLNNTFQNSYYYPFYSYYSANSKIVGNTISVRTSGSYSTSAYGLMHYYGFSDSIASNKITAPRNVLYSYYNNQYGTTNDTSYFVNNMLIGGTYTSANTVYLGYNDRCYFIGNSIYTASSYNSSSYASLELYYCDDAFVRNNSVSRPNGGYSFQFYYGSRPDLDYNNFYAPSSSSHLYYNGSSYSSVSAYATGSSQGSNSIEVDPQYFSTTDLRSESINLNNKGDNVLRFNSDFEGNPRPAVPDATFDIGCSEYYLPDYDADVVAIITQPLIVGSNTISAQLKNNGIKSWTSSDSVYLEYTIGSTTVKDTVILGAIAPGGTVDFDFTVPYTHSGTNAYQQVCINFTKQFKAEDPDTLNEEYCQDLCVTGVSNLVLDGGGNGDFETFQDAANYLSCAGVSSALTILVKNGTYNEQVEFGPVNGASATNTIRFVGESQNAVLTSAYSSYPDFRTLVLNGAKHFVFDSLTIEAVGPTYGWAVHLYNAADSNTITNCNINAVDYTSTTCAGIVASSSATSLTSSGNNANGCTFSNNRITGGYYGIAIRGNSTSSRAENNTIENNTIRNAYYYGIYLYYPGNNLIKGNDVDSLNNTSGRAFYSYYGSGNSVMNNHFKSGQYGLALYYENAATSDTSAVVNNMVSNLSNTTVQYGIYSYSNDEVSFIHNSVWCDHTSSSSTYPAFRSYYDDYCIIKNNAIASTGGGYSFYKIGSNWNAGDIDYNAYYAPNSSNHIYWDGSLYSSVSSLSSAQSSYNQNALEVDPGFISENDLHSFSDNINNKGDNTTTWPMDVDGNPRPTSPDVTVDIGADDFWIPLYDIDVAAIDSPGVVMLGNNTIKATFQNRGLRNLKGETAHVSYTINNGTPVEDTIDFLFLPVGADTLFAFTVPWNVNTSSTFNICVSADTIINKTSDAADAICVTKCTGVKDTITVDPNGNGDFLTINGAINRLNCGVYGPTVVLLKEGTYNESLALSENSTINSTNTVTIMGENKSKVIWNPGSTSSFATITLDGADYFTFKNMTIKNMNTDNISGTVFWLGNNADYITIDNCELMASESTTNSNTAVIAASGSASTVYSTGYAAEHLTISNCNISGGYRGISIYGPSTFTTSEGLVVSNNTFTQQYYYPVYTYGREVCEYSGNIIEPFRNTFGYAMYIYYNQRTQIFNNQIESKYYGIYNYYNNYNGSTSDSSWVYNNHIYLSNNNFSSYPGIYGYRSDRNMYWNNTIVTTTLSTSTFGAGIYMFDNDNSQAKNNNIYAAGNGYLMYISSGNLASGSINHNNYYAPTTFRVYSSSTYSSLAAWQSGQSGYNQNSVSENPYLVSTDDYHASSPYLMNAGENLGISTDLDGEMRDANMPDIGADEISKDISISSVLYPLNACRSTGDLDSVKFEITNVGLSSFVEGDTLLVTYVEGTATVVDTLAVPSGMVFGNGMEAEVAFDSLVNAGNPGTHNLNVYVTYFRDADHTNDSMDHAYFTNPNPNAAYTVAEQCEYETSEFKDGSNVALGKVTNWNWMFGDGNGSTMQNPDYDYGVFDTFNVRLAIATDSGCVDTMYGNAITHPKPMASFTNDNECHHTQSDFTNASTVAYGTLSYAWNFGDNTNTSTSTNPSLTYSNDGNYNVELIATSNNGCKDTTTITTTIYPTPNPDFTATEECYTNTTNFTNSTNITSGTYNSSWDFDDGNSSSLSNPNNTYSAAGTYTVKLKATSTANGCEDSVSKSVTVNPLPTSSFAVTNMCYGDTMSVTNNSTGAGLTYQWYFGDGNTSTDQTPIHVYANSGTYTVSLVVTTNKGCKDSSSAQTSVATQPLADFTFSNDCVHNSITFTNATSVACGVVSKYYWNYGDGNSEVLTTNSNPSHKYDKPGSYTVELIIELANSTKDTATKSVTVYSQPVANFSNNASCQGNLMQFTNTSQAQTSTTLSSFSWTFGDGGTSTLKNPTNTYSNSGSYNVRMIVEDSRSCIDTITKQLTVSPNPSAAFSFTNACAYDSVKFSNSSTVSSGSISNYDWDFGNNTTANTRQTSVVYGNSGYYTVKMVATTNAGCKDSVTKTVQAFTIPSARFTANNVCDNESMSFNNVSSNANSYAWDFGDMMGTSSMSSPSYTYGSDGSYDVELVLS